jgi:hypothetical protein
MNPKSRSHPEFYPEPAEGLSKDDGELEKAP